MKLGNCEGREREREREMEGRGAREVGKGGKEREEGRRAGDGGREGGGGGETIYNTSYSTIPQSSTSLASSPGSPLM